MDFFDNWKPIWRWVLFIPLFFFTYIVLNVLNSFTIGNYLGPYDESSIFSFIFYRFYMDTVCLGASIVISSLCIPKGKIITASIYLAIILVLFGLTLSAMLNNTSYYPTWKLIYSSITIILGGVGALLYVINSTKNERLTDSKPSFY